MINVLSKMLKSILSRLQGEFLTSDPLHFGFKKKWL